VVLISEGKCVYCAVRPEYLITLQFKYLKRLTACKMLTLNSKAFLDKLIVPNLIDKFAAFDITRNFNSTNDSPPRVPILS